ncbi:hypothetical protein [Micromonospora cathayae]|uniref:Uncharacterized protein n=1 Tax=Micromonospora cathayae TaxID=3028804 RepID=A0ABY7ZME8_9ACTN|nr:hypothetical protein [Micromonospora sp. HUAS 3]WDZ84202.1 hypothetical protein PVK37_27695 [Micromonospora sp. HUAS 3]
MPRSDQFRDQPHAWRTVSRHLTSEGQVRYQRCRCGRWRVVLDGPSTAAEVGRPSEVGRT